jgi:hypothetical protein
MSQKVHRAKLKRSAESRDTRNFRYGRGHVAEVVAELVGADVDGGFGGSGAEGNRTPDLSDAIRTLCQLSYSPGKLVIGCPV